MLSGHPHATQSTQGKTCVCEPSMGAVRRSKRLQYETKDFTGNQSSLVSDLQSHGSTDICRLVVPVTYLLCCCAACYNMGYSSKQFVWRLEFGAYTKSGALKCSQLFSLRTRLHIRVFSRPFNGAVATANSFLLKLLSSSNTIIQLLFCTRAVKKKPLFWYAWLRRMDQVIISFSRWLGEKRICFHIKDVDGHRDAY
eukprot:SAG31_NODE_2711_length_5208_cov_12.009395_2_plen_197_part_00